MRTVAILMSLVLLHCIAFAQVPTKGLMASFRFNGDAQDSSGKGNNGTVVGGVAWTTDRFGNTSNAAEFNGTDAYIRVLPSDSMIIENDITVCAWVKSSASQENKFIIEKYYAGTFDHGWYLATYDETSFPGQGGQGHFGGRDGRGGAINIQSGPSGYLSDSAWHFVVGQRNGNVWKVYLDGNLRNSIDPGGTPGSIESSGALRIGARDLNGDGSDYWSGALDDIRIYNRALSEPEIRTLYHEGGWLTGLVAFYPFSGNAQDSSGKGNNGTVVGGVAWTIDRFGNRTNAAEFNGTDAYIRVLPSDSMMVENDITVCAWVKSSTSQENKFIIEKYYAGTFDHGWFLATYDEASFPGWGGQGLFGGRDGRGGAINIQCGPSGHLSNSAWHFLVGQRNGNVWKVYLDGNLRNSIDPGGTPGSIESSGGLRIGARDFNGGGRDYWSGTLDDIRIYNRALSEPEIRALSSDKPKGEPVGVDVELPNIPTQVTLCQNYPNPFNPSTTIRYGLPHSSSVTLTIFNVIGQQVAILFQGDLEAGYHEVRFDGRGLSSGVYFCTLQAGGLQQTRKFILVR